MPQELQLPDGRILVIPDNITLDQRVALRNKLGAQYADVKTGAGMQQRAALQANRATANAPMMQRDIVGRDVPVMTGQEQEKDYSKAFGSQPGITLSDADVATMGMGAGGIGRSIATRGLRATAGPVAKSLIGGMAGSYGGGKAGKYFAGDTGEAVGKVAGGLAGGYLGATGEGIPSRASLMERILARQPAATEAAAETVGSAAATPGITKVPIRSTPSSPLTPEQVPGPDLSSAAGRGDPRAASEMMRRGQQVLYTPAEEYPNAPLQGTLEERIRGSATPPAPAETEDFMERMRRRAPGVNPATKSIRRKMGRDTARMAAEDEALRRSKRQ